MVNQWLRLWHEMPTDPKWRTIAKASGASISEVVAVYVHLLVQASANANERGRTQANAPNTQESIASALDLETDTVTAIIKAMQGRVLDCDDVMGWKVRQPIKEDGSRERSKAWREAKKAETTTPNESERKRTLPNASERQDKEGSKDPKRKNSEEEARAVAHAATARSATVENGSKPKVAAKRSKAQAEPAEPVGDGVAVFREVFERYPLKECNADFERLHGKLGVEVYRARLVWWKLHGYNPKNYAGMLEVLEKGPTDGNGRDDVKRRPEPEYGPRLEPWEVIR